MSRHPFGAWRSKRSPPFSVPAAALERLSAIRAEIDAINGQQPKEPKPAAPPPKPRDKTGPGPHTAAERIAKARGWQWRGGYTIALLSAENPPRQGVPWNTKESLDLIAHYFAGWSVERLAHHHGRTEGGISAQLGYVEQRGDTAAYFKLCAKAAARGDPIPEAGSTQQWAPPAPLPPTQRKQTKRKRKHW